MEFRNFFKTEVEGYGKCKVIYMGTLEEAEDAVMDPSSPWCGPGCDEERYVDDFTVISNGFDVFHHMDQELQEEVVNEAFQHFDANH